MRDTASKVNEPLSSIRDLVIIADRAACPACGSAELITGSSNSLRCHACDRLRGRLSAKLADFLHQSVIRFGRPERPVIIRTPFAIWSSAAADMSCSKNGN
jgi:hypothetical protein